MYLIGDVWVAHRNKKNQVKIPRKILDTLGAKDGDYLVFFQVGKDTFRIVRAKRYDE